MGFLVLLKSKPPCGSVLPENTAGYMSYHELLAEYFHGSGGPVLLSKLQGFCVLWRAFRIKLFLSACF